jgi:hypothetical protein
MEASTQKVSHFIVPLMSIYSKYLGNKQQKCIFEQLKG